MVLEGASPQIQTKPIELLSHIPNDMLMELLDMADQEYRRQKAQWDNEIPAEAARQRYLRIEEACVARGLIKISRAGKYR